jgi:beta-phosphoglucomutase-like phosphatase (HAD superfamily)
LLEYFAILKTGDQVARTKPAPDLYLAALDALGVRADQAIALEDSPHGVRSAQNAGIFCVAVPNQLTGRLPLEHADLRLTSMAALPLEELLRTVEEKYQTSLSS